jgi:hypothetical protein
MLIQYIEYFRLVTGNFLSRSFLFLCRCLRWMLACGFHNVTLATTINLYFPCNLSTINKFCAKANHFKVTIGSGGPVARAHVILLSFVNG